MVSENESFSGRNLNRPDCKQIQFDRVKPTASCWIPAVWQEQIEKPPITLEQILFRFDQFGPAYRRAKTVRRSGSFTLSLMVHRAHGTL